MLSKMLELENLDQVTQLIDENVILKMAEEINYKSIYKEVFGLYGVSWDKNLDDIILTMKKLDFNY